MPLGHYLLTNVDGWRNVVNPKHDKDLVVLILGEERIGKSTLGFEIASYFDKDFTVKNIAWDVKAYKRLVYSVPKCSAIMADEGVSMFFSRNAMSRDNKEAVDLFTICGHQNLLHIICATRLSGLDSYLKDGRIGVIIRVVARGRYKFYSKNKVKSVKKLPNGKYVWPTCSFTEGYSYPPENKEEYAKYKKAKADYNKERLAPAEEDGLMLLAEAARYAHRNTKTIKRWVEKKLLEVKVIKGKTYYDAVDIDKIIEAKGA